MSSSLQETMKIADLRRRSLVVLSSKSEKTPSFCGLFTVHPLDAQWKEDSLVNAEERKVELQWPSDGAKMFKNIGSEYSVYSMSIQNFEGQAMYRVFALSREGSFLKDQATVTIKISFYDSKNLKHYVDYKGSLGLSTQPCGTPTTPTPLQCCSFLLDLSDDHASPPRQQERKINRCRRPTAVASTASQYAVGYTTNAHQILQSRELPDHTRWRIHALMDKIDAAKGSCVRFMSAVEFDPTRARDPDYQKSFLRKEQCELESLISMLSKGLGSDVFVSKTNSATSKSVAKDILASTSHSMQEEDGTSGMADLVYLNFASSPVVDHDPPVGSNKHGSLLRKTSGSSKGAT